MNRFYYDLHIHSCLSPCADNDNTPNNIVGMGRLNGLNIMALTDHNSILNCPAFFKAAQENGIVPIAGMELTTSEDIHIVCLFETLSQAENFSKVVDIRRIKIENRSDIFGDQLIYNCDDKITGAEKFLLSNATTMSIEEVCRIVPKFSGICYPAHIDRESNGIISILGTFPQEYGFKSCEFKSKHETEKYVNKYKLNNMRHIYSSDAHYLWDIAEKDSFFELNADISEPYWVIKELFKYLRCEE